MRESGGRKHNLLILEDGQGGLLDVLYHEGSIFVSYSEYRGMRGYTSTSVAKGNFDKQNISVAWNVLTIQISVILHPYKQCGRPGYVGVGARRILKMRFNPM